MYATMTGREREPYRCHVDPGGAYGLVPITLEEQPPLYIQGRDPGDESDAVVECEFCGTMFRGEPGATDCGGCRLTEEGCEQYARELGRRIEEERLAHGPLETGNA